MLAIRADQCIINFGAGGPFDSAVEGRGQVIGAYHASGLLCRLGSFFDPSITQFEFLRPGVAIRSGRGDASIWCASDTSSPPLSVK